MSDQSAEEVGFASPPAATRFKKGKSGNPAGRPKKPNDIYTQLRKVLMRKISIKGAEKKMQISEALIRKLKEVALSGDQRALALQRRLLEESAASQPTGLTPEETRMKVLNAFENMGVKVNYGDSHDEK